MTAEKGKHVKLKKSAAVVAGAIMALGLASPAFADADAKGAAIGSPGVLSGNVIQVPIHVPINVCGNSINVIALLNPAFGNTCIND
ncbi:chaplin [Streptomyces sp. NPDC060065]|uniref:chaplin n=1 Tax=Streptomyces sp. NPDC060065 TaxID=3347050 RepID=UPI0036BD17C3